MTQRHSLPLDRSRGADSMLARFGRRGALIRGISGMAAAWVGLAAVPAGADVLPPAESLSLEVVGAISPICQMGGVNDVDFGDLTIPGKQYRTHAGLYCNLPFDMVLTSANGGLAHSEMPMGQGPYAGRVSYDLAVRLPVRTPTESVVSRTIDSLAMLGGQVVSSGDGIATDGVDFHIALHTPAGEGLLAGQYADTVTVKLAPRI